MRGAQVVVGVVATSSTRHDMVHGVRAWLMAEPAHIAVTGEDAGALALILPPESALGRRAPLGVPGALAGRASHGR